MLKSFLSGIGFRGLNILILLIVTPLQAKLLGLDGYGKLVLINSIIGFGGLLELGLSQASIKFLNSAKEAKATEFNSIKTVFGLISIFFLIVGSAIYYVLEGLDILSFGFGDLTYIIIASISFKVFNQYFNSLLLSRDYFHESNTSAFVGFVVRHFVPLGFVILGYTTELATAFGSLISVLGPMVYSAWMVKRKSDIPWFSGLELNFAYIRTVFRSAKHLFLSQVGGELALHADKFIISSTLGPASLGVYNIAYTLVARVNDIGYLLSSISFPRFCQQIENGHFQILRALFIRIQVLSYCFSVLAIAGFFVLGPDLIELWLEGNVPEGAFEVAAILLVGVTVGIGNWSCSNLLVASHREKYVSRIVLLTSIISVILCATLSSIYGIIGAAISWSLSYVVMTALFYVVAFRIRLFALDKVRTSTEVSTKEEFP